jgi:hypothetical protein
LPPDFPAGVFGKPGFDPYPVQGKGGGQGRKFHLDFPGQGMIHQETYRPVFPGQGGLGEGFRYQPGRFLGFQRARQQKARQEQENHPGEAQ